MKSAFSNLHRASALQALSLTFNDNLHAPRRPGHPVEHHKLQHTILNAIASNQKPLQALKSLTLYHLLPYDGELYASPPFKTIFASLKSLELHFLYDTRLIACYTEPLHTYFEHVVEDILRPAQELENLALSSNRLLDVGPQLVDLQSLYLPKLASLTVGRIIFDRGIQSQDSDGNRLLHGSEDFILNFASTLQSLRMWECYVEIPRLGEHQCGLGPTYGSASPSD